MAYVKVPKDLTKIKTKVALGLTMRQIICFGAGALVGIPAFFFLRRRIGVDAAALVMVCIMIPAFVFGLFERDGQPLEKLLGNVLRTRYIFPNRRPYRTRNAYAELGGKIRLTENRKLSEAEKQRLVDAFMRKRGKTIPRTAQETIPYREIRRDGICVTDDGIYSKMIVFDDISYSLASDEDKRSLFERWCKLLNYFDDTVTVQFYYQNCAVGEKEFQFVMAEQEDGHDRLREEFGEIVRQQYESGNRNIRKKKYLIFGVKADSLGSAKQRLERIEADVLANFKNLGVRATPLTGYERLEVLHTALHPCQPNKKFRFAWDAIAQTGLSSKDFTAPDGIEFNAAGDGIKVDGICGAVSYLQVTASELDDRLLASLLELNKVLTVSIHIQAIDQLRAIKEIKQRITSIEAMKIEQQKKAVRAGYDMDIIPADIDTYGMDARALLEDLQARNERMFLVTLIIENYNGSLKGLRGDLAQVKGIVQKADCALSPLRYQQEQGFVSCLPLGVNRVEIQRGLTTSSTAGFVPFTSQELSSVDDREGLYYGVNSLTRNIVVANKKVLRVPNSLILGSPGSGKSFATKFEILNVFLRTQDDVAIIDPEDEYGPLVTRLGGQLIEVSAESQQYINPMDLTITDDDEDPVSLKSDFILSLMELILGGRSGLEPVERTIIDRSVRMVYREYLRDPVPEKMPVLGDLHALLLQQPEQEAQRLATALEIYVSGSLNVFNHRTNVKINSRIVCYVIKKLGNQLKKIGMQIVQDQIWGRVSANRDEGKATRVYIDEMHLLLRDADTAAYTMEIWKRFRKWGGMPTGITQNVKDFFKSGEIQNILDNSDFILLLNQGSGDRDIVVRALNISPHQIGFVSSSNPGEGLLFYGGAVIPFQNRFPRETELYRLMTTKLEEVK